MSFKAGGRSPFEIIADFNRQEMDKLEFFNRPNKERARDVLMKSRKSGKNLKFSLYNKFVKEIDKIRKLETSLSSEVLTAYVTSDPLYKELATSINKNDISREVDVTRARSISPDTKHCRCTSHERKLKGLGTVDQRTLVEKEV
jgi:hypothetical protein